MKIIRYEKILFWILSWILACSMLEASQVPRSSKKLNLKQTLHRKKRYVVYPDGAAVTATMAISKTIATNFPRGVNYIGEADIYYPLPIKIADWYPKDSKPKAKIDTAEHFDSITESNKRYSWTSEDSYANRQYKHRYEFSQPTNSINRTSPSLMPLRRQSSFENDYYYDDWKRNRGFRERRNIYSHIDLLAEQHGMDIKACLLRLICEVRHFVLPPGKSFFHDILRILFTNPVHESINDEYASAMRAEKDECISSYTRDCQYSILGLLLNRKKHSFV